MHCCCALSTLKASPPLSFCSCLLAGYYLCRPNIPTVVVKKKRGFFGSSKKAAQWQEEEEAAAQAARAAAASTTVDVHEVNEEAGSQVSDGWEAAHRSWSWLAGCATCVPVWAACCQCITLPSPW